jgi:hypothetical protein
MSSLTRFFFQKNSNIKRHPMYLYLVKSRGSLLVVHIIILLSRSSKCINYLNFCMHSGVANCTGFSVSRKILFCRENRNSNVDYFLPYLHNNPFTLLSTLQRGKIPLKSYLKFRTLFSTFSCYKLQTLNKYIENTKNIQ